MTTTWDLQDLGICPVGNLGVRKWEDTPSLTRIPSLLAVIATNENPNAVVGSACDISTGLLHVCTINALGQILLCWDLPNNRDVQQNPWPLTPRCHEHHRNDDSQKTPQTFLNVLQAPTEEPGHQIANVGFFLLSTKVQSWCLHGRRHIHHIPISGALLWGLRAETIRMSNSNTAWWVNPKSLEALSLPFLSAFSHLL